MARQPRIEFEGAWYHVMNRGAGRRRIFHDDEDCFRFFELLGEISQIWNVEIHSYSLMDNHYHLLICTPNGGISKAMRHFGAEYTQYYNRKYKTDGALFRGRFKSILTERDTYLSRLVRYIHLNPVSAGLCKNPAEHRWTSHAAYLKRKYRPSWLKTHEVLSDFGVHEKEAITRFNEYVVNDDMPDFVEIMEGKRRARILGSVGFRDWVKDNVLDTVSYEKKRPLIRGKKRHSLPVKQVLDYVANEFQIPATAISKRSGSQFNEAKALAIYLLRSVNGMTHAEISKIFKMKPQAVSKYLQRLKVNQEKNEVLKTRAKVYQENLLYHVQS